MWMCADSMNETWKQSHQSVLIVLKNRESWQLLVPKLHKGLLFWAFKKRIATSLFYSAYLFTSGPLLIHYNSYTTYGKMFQEHTHTALGANAHKHRCWGAHVHTHIQQRKWPHAAQRNCCCSTLHSQPHSWVPCRHSCTMWQECAVSVAVSLVKGSLN